MMEAEERAKKQRAQIMSDSKKKPAGSLPGHHSNDLSSRFSRAQKDNPKLTYDKIYKDMKVDMNSEDTSVYKEAEDKWLKKHGY